MAIFRFKKFFVCDDRATMKVGTDAVLLGAWSDIAGAKRILDLGSGSGVIALMMAQRSDADARVDAIEMLADDAAQSMENIRNSPWPAKIAIVNSRVQIFSPPNPYDLIVCNPPFFSKSLLPPRETRSYARHTTSLTADELLDATLRMLSPAGKFCVILPTLEAEIFAGKANSKKLFMNRLTRFFTRAHKPQERSLMEFGFTSLPLPEDSVTLYQSENEWTSGYKQLTKEFYLDP